MFYSGPRRPGRPRPGKTSRYRRASLDRAGEGTRPYVCFSISKICCGSVRVLLYSEIFHATAAELIHVRCAIAFDHCSEISPTVCRALGIGALDVHNRGVWVQSSHCPQRLLRRKWRKYLIEEMIPFRDIAAQRSLRGEKRHTHRPGLQCERDGKVGHVENLHPVLLDGAAEVVTRAHHDVANPCRNYLLNTSCANHLVEQNV